MRSKLALVGVAFLAGLGAAAAIFALTRSHSSRVPAPTLADFLPPNYRVTHEWRAPLSGQAVPEAVVASVGPAFGSLQFHAADLQVLSWDAVARRWILAFDAQKAVFPADIYTTESSNAPVEPLPDSTEETPLLDRKANAGIDKVAFARLMPGSGEQLIFTAHWDYERTITLGSLIDPSAGGAAPPDYPAVTF